VTGRLVWHDAASATPAPPIEEGGDSAVAAKTAEVNADIGCEHNGSVVEAAAERDGRADHVRHRVREGCAFGGGQADAGEGRTAMGLSL